MFKGDLEDLFGVASMDVLDQMTVEEDKALLRSQREGRTTSSMVCLDCVTAQDQERKKEKERAEEIRKERPKKNEAFVIRSDSLTSSSSFSPVGTDESEVDLTCPSPTKRNKVQGAKSKSFLSADISSTSDRFKVSDRVAKRAMEAIAVA